jgi:hypothetical protein
MPMSRLRSLFVELIDWIVGEDTMIEGQRQGLLGKVGTAWSDRFNQEAARYCGDP